MNNVVPGAQVQLFVNNHQRNAPVDSIQAETGPPTGTPPRISGKSAGRVAAVGDERRPHRGPNALRRDQTSYRQRRRKGSSASSGSEPGHPGRASGRPWEQQQLFYVLTTSSGGCANLLNVSVTIVVTKAIVWASTGPSTPPGAPFAPPGFSFQLNCYSPTQKSPNFLYPAWQQYIINLWSGQLLGAINTWHTFSTPVIFPGGEYTTPLGPILPSNTIPAGYTLTITLGNDYHITRDDTRVVGDERVIGDRRRANRRIHTGPGRARNGESAVLTSGAGTITYSATSPLTVTNAEPTQCVEQLPALLLKQPRPPTAFCQRTPATRFRKRSLRAP